MRTGQQGTHHEVATRTDLSQAIASTLTDLLRLEDDLDINGNLTVPQARYRIDVRKLAAALNMTRTAMNDVPVNAVIKAKVDDRLATASVLIASQQIELLVSGRMALDDLQKVSSDIAMAQNDMGLGPGPGNTAGGS